MAAPRKEDLRARIVDTAARLLQSTSFEGITLADIATAAGISKGTLYYYYNSKDDILLDVCDTQLTALNQQLTAWADNREKDTRAPRFLRYVLQYGTDTALGSLRLHLLEAAASGRGKMRERYIRLYHQFEETLTQQLHRRLPGANAPYLAWLLLTMMDGTLVQKRLKNPHFDTDAFLEESVAFLCAQEPATQPGAHIKQEV